jgi:hypothetical protein
MGYKFIFLVFFEELLYATTWLNYPKDEEQNAKKKFALPIASLILTFFIIFLLMVLHDVIFNVTTMI